MKTRYALEILFLVLTVTGCGDRSTGPARDSGVPSSVVPLTGYYAGATDDGKASLSISTAALSAPAPAVAADSTLAPAYATLSRDGGGTAVLAGVYDAAADTLVLSGSGYALRGSLEVAGPPNILAGSFGGPSGSGTWRCLSGNSQTVAVYCGTFSSAVTMQMGRWHFVAGGGALYGAAYLSADTTGLEVAGTASGTGSSLTLSANGGDGSRTLSLTGSLDVDTRTASGAWSIAQGGTVIDHGSWSAVPCLDGTTSGN